jgi:hypothetical protein
MPVGFRIDPSEARTDLYGIGKGAAQVLDLSPLREQAAQEQKQNFIKKQEAQKAGEDRLSGVYSQLALLNKISILPREQKMFADEQTALYDDVKKNISAIRAGDANALLAIQQRIGELNTKAELSKNTREQIEAITKEMLSKGYDKYRPQSIEYMNDFINNPANNGNYNYDPSQISERIDLADFVNKDLAGYAREQAPNDRGYKSNTPEQRKELLLNALHSDPLKMRQANDDFEAATDKLGAKDASEYFAKKYDRNITVNDKPPYPVSVAYPDESKNINVTNTVNDNGGEITVMNKSNNESVRVTYDDKGNVTGGVQGTRLTPEEKTQNDAVFKSNIAKKKAYNDALAKAKTFAATIDQTTMTPEDYKAAMKLLAAKTPKKSDPSYAEEELPYQEKDIELTAEQAQEIAHNKFGIKPKEVIQGKAPRTVDVQHVDEKTKTEGAKKKTVSRATIKAKVGTKGFEGYSEKELVDYYTSQGYTVK